MYCEPFLLFLPISHHVFMTKQPEFTSLAGWQFPISHQPIDIVWAAFEKVGHVLGVKEELVFPRPTS